MNRMAKRWGILLGMAWLFSGMAQAYIPSVTLDGTEVKWAQVPSLPIPYWHHQDGTEDVTATEEFAIVDTSFDTWVDDLAKRTYSGIQWRCEGNKPHGKLHKQFTKGITKAFETSIARFGVFQATDFNASKRYFAVHQEVFQARDPGKRIDNLDLS